MTSSGDFTAQADAYSRARPGYPESLVERLVERAGIAPGEPVADLGAGTGLFTELLVHRGLNVTAVEPNAAMRSHARVRMGVRWIDGTFDSTGLDARSQRWVTAAQAFHWADPETALPEVHRILEPGGHFTVLWNNRDADASEVLAWTRRRIHDLVPGFDEGYRTRDWAQVLTSTRHFVEVEQDEVAHVVRMSPRRYLDLWRSHHKLGAAAGPASMAQLLEAIEAHVGDFDRVDVAYRCRAFTVRRKG